MKRIIISFALSMLAVAAFAQPRAIGVRLGGDAEISYQHYLNGDNWIEGDLGIAGWSGIQLTGIYDFNIARDCFSVIGLNFYAGPGLQLGYVHPGDRHFGLGIGGQVGMEYCFPRLPLNLSLDYRPMWNLIGSFVNWASVSIGVRYAF